MRTAMLVHEAAVELRAPAEGDARLLRKLRKIAAPQAPNRVEWIVCVDGDAAGYVSASASASELRVHELAFLRTYEGRGIRTALVGELVADAARLGLPLKASVGADEGPLQELYQAHGLDVQRADEEEVHLASAPIVWSDPPRSRARLFRRNRLR